jgi:multimeric flavodoxin WrbA
LKILGICGSPRKDGNTTFALRYALEKAEALGADTEFITLRDKQLTPCNGCFSCRSGKCVFDDDMSPIYDAILDCDGLVLASPVYLGMVSGQMKVMMDRTVLYRADGRFALSGKVGGGIACGGARNGGQELTLQNMHTYFLQQDMLAISDGPPGSHSGAAVFGKAAEDKIGLNTIEALVRRMVAALSRRPE